MRHYLLFILLITFSYTLCGLDVDMDPAPRIPLRNGESQYFLIHLSNAKAACSGTVDFSSLGDSLKSDPAKQDFDLKPGEEKILIFNISCSSWGADVIVRPKVTVKGNEQINFPEQYKTVVVRDAKKLDKKPLDDKGLLAYYSCGDLTSKEYTTFDRSSGLKKFWEEGIWYNDGGVKGKAVFGCNGNPYPRHRWSKIAYETMNNINYRKGTIMFWIRKSRRRAEIPYASRFKGDPKETWKIGPNAMRGHEGEGILGHVWSVQAIYVRWYLKKKRPWKPFKPGSDCFIGMRRYKAVSGVTDGFLEATYKAMRGKIYHVQAPYKWTEDWRHVALVWDTSKAKLEIWLDGELASSKLMLNGKPCTDKLFYGAPWTVVQFCNAALSIVAASAEGSRSATDRDEYYVYNKALSQQEIQENMKASMGNVVKPEIVPGDSKFNESIKVTVRSYWANPAHHYTLDGTEPTEASPQYKEPITITKTASLKVKSFLKGFKPSETVSVKLENLGADTAKPKVTHALSINNPKGIMVCFNEKVDKASAEKAGRYSISGGVSVTGAKLDPDMQVVNLILSGALKPGAKLTVKNVKDLSAAGNTSDETPAQVDVKDLPGLIGFWNFDLLSTPTIKDLTTYKVDGTAWEGIYPGVKRVEGKKGKGIYLDGHGDLIDIADYKDEKKLAIDTKSHHNLEKGTFAIWFKVDKDLKGWKPCLASKTYAFFLHVTKGTIWYESKDSKAKVQDDKWHHVVLTYQNKIKDGIKIYLDGKLVLTTQKSFLRNINNGIGIGVGGGGYGQPKFFKGAVDEAMLFNRILSAEEAKKLYETGNYLATKKLRSKDI